jgi:nucleoside-diphosphate-sugar epimerase
MRVIVIGGRGFVGSAFVRFLQARGVDCLPVTRENYEAQKGSGSDVVIDAACNSRKFWAEERPLEEFETSVAHRVRTLRDFPADFHIHLSSVDVYSDLAEPEATREDSEIRGSCSSNYGFHKLLAEQLVSRYAGRWLIARLAGMVGPGLRKNPVFDILHGQPLRIHPDSQYQFLSTQFVASAVWELFSAGVCQEVFNVCGRGLISPREIATLAGKPLDQSLLPAGARPRIVRINIGKLEKRMPVAETADTVRRFVADFGTAP